MGLLYLVTGQASSPVFFIEAPGRPVFVALLPPAPNRGRAGRQGSNWTRGPQRLATSRLVDVLCARRSLWFERKGKACRKSAKPRASRARCFRLAPHRPRWSAVRHAVPKNPRRDSPPLKPGRSAGGHADWTTGLPAVRGLGVRKRHAGIMRGLDRRGKAPHLRRPPFPGHRSPPRVWRR